MGTIEMTIFAELKVRFETAIASANCSGLIPGIELPVNWDFNYVTFT